jgi:hypothetical protein
MNTREVLPHIIAFRCIWDKICSKVFLTEMEIAMEKAGTLGLTERLGSASGPMVGATVSMRHAKSTPKQNNKKRRGQGHQRCLFGGPNIGNTACQPAMRDIVPHLHATLL